MMAVKFNEGGGAGNIRVFKSEISDLGVTRFNLFSVLCFYNWINVVTGFHSLSNIYHKIRI